MARKALVETATGLVVNIIEIETGANWPIPKGHTLRSIGVSSVSAGYTWTGLDYVAPATIPPTAQEAAATRLKTATVANKDKAPFGRMFYDQAVARGEIDA